MTSLQRHLRQNTLIVTLLAAAFPSPSRGLSRVAADTVESNIREAPESIVIDGKHLRLRIFAHLDEMPTPIPGEPQMFVIFHVLGAPPDSKLTADRGWLLLDEKHWSSTVARRPSNQALEFDTKHGPSSRTGTHPDGVLRLCAPDGSTHLLAARHQEIARTS